jgi:two-component sensor histidine kinase
LEGAARSYARGEEVVESEALENAPDEIRSLRRTMAAMAKTLRGREQRLVEALGEERALLREVHHRVKNNLQMVASLLNIQARGAKDESEAWGLARAHDRVQLLALVHQRIYSSGELRELRLDDLTGEIARQLVQARGAQTKDLRLSMHLTPTRADTDHAMPLTFLIGEAISFALDCCEGAEDLAIWLGEDESQEIRFAVECSASPNTAAGAGARLIDAFARQLGADVGRDQARPAALWVRVPPAPAES